MLGTISIAGIVVSLIVIGTGTTAAWAAQLDATIHPDADESPFKMSYLKTINIWYEDGGVVADELRGNSFIITDTVNSNSNADAQTLVDRLNQKIFESGSLAKISDVDVYYELELSGGDDFASLDYKIILEGLLVDYIITSDSQKSLIDLGWRGMTVDGNVVINGQEINDPFSFVDDNIPVTADMISSTAAARIFEDHLINADFVLEQPLTNWHFLFDPTGVNVDAKTFGLSSDISGFVKSSWTMGESNIQQGRQVERIIEEIVTTDQTYIVKSVQSPDQGNLHIIGFGVADSIDGVEIAGVTPTPPEGYGNTATGDFPIFIIYGMAGLAAVAGIAFFFVSNRSLKNEKQGQQGIDPQHLVGYQTSASSGGYQTNRGEAQLKSDSDYQQTRSHYEQDTKLSTAPESLPESAVSQQDATCGCSASLEMGTECDCDMQGSCICDYTCNCTSSLCKEISDSMR